MDATLREVKSLLAEVNRKMDEFQCWKSYVKPMDMTAEIPMEIVKSLNEVILDKSPVSESNVVAGSRDTLSWVDFVFFVFCIFFIFWNI